MASQTTPRRRLGQVVREIAAESAEGEDKACFPSNAVPSDRIYSVITKRSRRISDLGWVSQAEQAGLGLNWDQLSDVGADLPELPADYNLPRPFADWRAEQARLQLCVYPARASCRFKSI